MGKFFDVPYTALETIKNITYSSEYITYLYELVLRKRPQFYRLPPDQMTLNSGLRFGDDFEIQCILFTSIYITN